MYKKPYDRLKQILWGKHKKYTQEFFALKNISLSVKRGERIGIIGRNGCGKSTLLQILAGTLNPTGGSIRTKGRIAALLELGSGFDPEFTGRENVFINGEILGLSKNEINDKFSEIEAFASIGEFIDQPVKTYSSGMMVRLAFSVAACVSPDILIVDEALSVGDAFFQFKCLQRLNDLCERGTTLLFVSHDMSMVKNFCNRVVYLKHGELFAEGPPDYVAELYSKDINEERLTLAGAGVSAVSKEGLNSNVKAAFGTDEGRIISAYFYSNGEGTAIITGGRHTHIAVHYELYNNIKGAALSFLVQDKRLLDIGGQSFVVDSAAGEAVFIVSFKADLAAGKYFITPRLERRISSVDHIPIDRQQGALTLEVITDDRKFLGVVDLKIQKISCDTQVQYEATPSKDELLILMENILPGNIENAKPSIHREVDLQMHLEAIKGEFQGRSKLLFEIASSIVMLRRGQNIIQSWGFIRQALQEEKLLKFVVENLNSRWLLSVCDTYSDYGDHEESLAASGIVALFTALKLSETQRLIDGLSNSFYSAEYLESFNLPYPLWDGMTSYLPLTGDMPNNMFARQLRALGSQPILRRIYIELVGRAIKSDCLFSRFASVNSKFLPSNLSS